MHRARRRARRVALALPAGSLNKLPLAVPVRSPDVVVSRARSCGNGIVALGAGDVALQSALPVTFQCHCALSPLRSCRGGRCWLLVLRASGVEQGVAEPDQRAALIMLELGVQCRRDVAEELPVNVAEPRTSRFVPIVNARRAPVGRRAGRQSVEEDVALASVSSRCPRRAG